MIHHSPPHTAISAQTYRRLRMRQPTFFEREVARHAPFDTKPLHLSGVGCGRPFRKNFRTRGLAAKQSRVERFVGADGPSEREMLRNASPVSAAQQGRAVSVGQERKAFKGKRLSMI